MQGLYPRELGIPAQLLLLWVLGLVAGLSRARFPAGDKTIDVPFLPVKVNVPITLVILILVFVAVAARLFAVDLILLDPLYDVLAMIAGYWLGGVLQSKVPFLVSGKPPAAKKDPKNKKNKKKKEAS